MRTTTNGADPIGGATGSGKGSVLWSARPVVVDVGERQILVRVGRGGMLIGERELRYQLERKDNHPLARKPELLDLLAVLEDRGLLDSELCFRLTAAGRTRLAQLTTSVGEG